jgi:FlaA1/EpsC-like NDP-sugar epimerase
MNYFDKSVPIPDGAGSFGNFVVRRIPDLAVKGVRVLDRHEKKQHDMCMFELSFHLSSVIDANLIA